MRRVQFYWQSIRGAARRHPRWALVIAAVTMVGLGWGGYYLSRQLSARHHLQQARRALDDGNYPAALADLEACRKVWPRDPEVSLLLARTQWMSGNYSEADKQLRACKEAGGDAQQLALEAQMLAASAGSLEQVEVVLRKQLEAQHPDRRYILEALIRGNLIRQQAEEAERLATLWIEESPGHWQPWLLRGIARTMLSRELLSTTYEQAKSDFQHVLELKPDHDLACLLLGNAYVMTGQFREALPHLEHYHRLKPDDASGIGALAGCQRALGHVDDARRLLDEWLAGHSGTAEVFLVRGEVALDLGKPDEALDYFRRAQALAPNHEKIDYQLARALRALGRTEEANGYEEKWRTRNQLKERLKELAELAGREPQNVAVRHEAGTTALRLGDERAGMRWLASVLQIDPHHRATHEALAEHFRRKGDMEAAAFHQQLAQQSPK